MSNYLINYPKKTNFKDFNFDIKNPKIKYGLPKKIKFCKKCVISNQRPSSVVEFKSKINDKKGTINFDQNQICDACNLTEKKNFEINWEKREKELIKLCNKYRKPNGYDCIVPGSGGKDSFYASHILKNKYGMNPLTVTWAPNLYTKWGWENFQSWIHSGIDNYLITPNGKIHRLLTRLATEMLFHPFQPFIIGQKFIGAKMAKKFGIKLVFYGENEAEYGNPIATSLIPSRSKKFFTNSKMKDIYLGGVSYKDLIKKFGVRENELEIYKPLQEKDLETNKIEVHYLGYYLKWHPQNCFYYAIENSNFKVSPERTPGTYSKYNSIDDKIDDLHYYTTGIKFGIGRATYDASQEIRSGDISRQEGISLVKKFDIEFPKRFANEIFEYLSIDKKTFGIISDCFEKPIFDNNYLNDLTMKFRSPHIWCYRNNKWVLRKSIK